MKATYVSVWDGGIEISTSCDYDPKTNDVTNIEVSDTDGVTFLDEEYIILPDGTEIDRDDFTIDGESNEDTVLTDYEINNLKALVKSNPELFNVLAGK